MAPTRLAALLLGLALAWPAAARAEEAPGDDEADDGEASDEGERHEARYVLERVEVRGNRRTRDSVILREITYAPGQVLDLDDPGIELSRYRLLATGLFTDVMLSLRRGSRRGAVVLVVEVQERWSFILRELFLGVSEITPYGGFTVEEHNLLGRAISLSASLVAADRQQGFRASVAAPRFLDWPVSLSAGLLVNNARDFLGRSPACVSPGTGSADDPGWNELYQCVPRSYAEVAYQRVGGTFGAGVSLTHGTYLRLDYRLELIHTHLPGAASQYGLVTGPGTSEPIYFHLEEGRSVLSALVITVDRDTRDNPFLPSRGHHLSLETTISSDVIGSNYHYVKLTFLADFFFRFRWRHSLRVGLLVGSIFGEAPLYELYFIGDLSDQMHGRVLDLNFSHSPAPNLFSNAIEEMRYESLAGRLDVEYIVPLYRSQRVVYGLDFFLLAGLYALGSIEDFRSPPAGYPGGPFPLDFTVDVGFRLDTTAGVFGFSFRNLLGLIPFSED